MQAIHSKSTTPLELDSKQNILKMPLYTVCSHLQRKVFKHSILTKIKWNLCCKLRNGLGIKSFGIIYHLYHYIKNKISEHLHRGLFWLNKISGELFSVYFWNRPDCLDNKTSEKISTEFPTKNLTRSQYKRADIASLSRPWRPLWNNQKKKHRHRRNVMSYRFKSLFRLFSLLWLFSLL